MPKYECKTFRREARSREIALRAPEDKKKGKDGPTLQVHSHFWTTPRGSADMCVTRGGSVGAPFTFTGNNARQLGA